MAVWKVDWRVTDGENIKPIAIVQKMNDDNLNSLGGCRNSARMINFSKTWEVN